MRIRINGADADIQLEAEKNVGEILYGLDSWLSGTGHRLSGFAIDGKAADSGSMEAYFDKSVDAVKTLDITTSAIVDLFAEGLLHTLQDIGAYEAAGFEDKSRFAEQWKQSPQALLLADQSPDLFDWAVKVFSGEGASPQGFRLLLEERLGELRDPAAEMVKAGPLVEEICARLEDLSLDIQTGKDSRAAETASAFSAVAEKVFRVFNTLKLAGFPVEEITVENAFITTYITEFGTALRELLAAYEQHDTVLVGDLAEYEMAPRLRRIHAAILDAITRREL